MEGIFELGRVAHICIRITEIMSIRHAWFSYICGL